ncbi:MAG: plasmid stabilization protein [Schlesneria sp.]|nr:plasmid stabilization protein [Schlesneria sp.]
MTEVVFLDPALAELRQAAQWYDQQESGVGREFLTAVDQGLNRLLHDPTARPIAAERTHRQSLDRFPFELLYRICQTRIEIVAVAHHSRRPGYWQKRIR